MSREEGGFLGATLADDGAASEPVLTDDEEPDPSGFAAVLGGAASAGRRRGSGGDFRSTCGIGIGGQSFFPLRNRKREWCQKAERGWWNRRRRARLA